MDEVFAALADPTRRAVLQRLLDDGPTTATALSPSFAVSRQAVVKHLGVLADAGLVTAEPGPVTVGVGRRSGVTLF